jgi:hypothetical protein
MEIIKKGYVNRNGAYYNSGGLIEGTQRILMNHQSIYWQQGNSENFMALNDDDVKNEVYIDEAIYIGRIPTHFGHFIMEGLARLCDVVHFNKPMIGYITDGYLPKGIKPTPEKEIRWVIQAASSEPLYEINKNETYLVETLYVPKLPYHLSLSCSEPWRMSTVINKIIHKARQNNPDLPKIDKYYLSRYEDVKENNDYTYSDPTDSISMQIAKISVANELYGKIGSNTHLSLFARHNAKTNWTPRGSYQESDRNQLICDLIKTYNNF